MTSAKHWQRNLIVLNNITFFRSFMVIMPIFVPLMQRYGLSMRDIMLLQSAFAGVLLLCEIPSGFIADWFGRKLTLVVGFGFTGLGFSQILWADSFIELLIFEMTLGIGFSLVSGADIALAFESEKALAKPNQHAIGRLMSWMNFGEAASALTVFFLLKFDMHWLLWLQAIVGWLPFALSFLLTDIAQEHSKTAPKAQEVWPLFWRTPKLKQLTAVFIATMSATYLMTWLNQNLWLHYELPLQYFALMWGLFGLTVGLASRLSSRIPNEFYKVNTFSWLAAMLLLAYALLIIPHWLGVLFAGLLFSLFRGIAAAKIKLAVNNQIANEYRASINSITGASFRLATMVFGPFMGFAVDTFGAIATSQGFIVMLVPAILGLLMLGRKQKTMRLVV